MSLEIERRFLLENDEWKNFITHKTFIEQGYLSYDMDDWIVRIRFNGKNFKIALKKHIKNFTNYEFEYLIPSKDGEKIISNLNKTIKKERFFLKVNKRNWIIDCFKEKNYPLKIAEIELQEEKEEIIIPNFLSKEITGLRIFSNFSLTKYPLSKWKNEDLKNLNKN
tara:strand:+ start:918 stop:1415 length:498 start_codon:yes stop_codon:yes gene_type:complete